MAKTKVSNSERGVMSSLMQLFSTFIHKNAVEVAAMQERTLFDTMLEELKASSITQEKTSIVSTEQIIAKKTPNLSKFHLVLDIDGTLVHTVAQHEGMLFGEPDYEDLDLHLCSYKRPGLDKFIEFCFTHFQSVSLWTAGTQEYADFVARSIAPKGYQFLFVLSRMHCKDHPSIDGTLVKDMYDLWNSDIAKTFQINEENSFIIDDNEDYCSCNPKNAIVVKTWKYPFHAADFTFQSLMGYLSQSDADTAASLCWGAA
jgi:TFIIF-interacting CTD phosphatase-like protein